jgi:hypothetical protein
VAVPPILRQRQGEVARRRILRVAAANRPAAVAEAEGAAAVEEPAVARRSRSTSFRDSAGVRS